MVVNGYTGEQCSQVAKIGILRNFQVANFCSSAKFPLSSFSSVILLQISSGLIMHLRIQLWFIVFELNRGFMRHLTGKTTKNSYNM